MRSQRVCPRTACSHVWRSERYRRKATINTTNPDYKEWHRLRYQRHTVKIDGPSLREPQS